MNDERRRTYHALSDALGAKWTFHVLAALADAEYGFNELRRELGAITAKTLSARLSELRCLGFVEKEVHATSPPSTTYRLTESGRELVAVLSQVDDFVELTDCPDGDCVVSPDAPAECTCGC